jgi:hypothetical protein
MLRSVEISTRRRDDWSYLFVKVARINIFGTVHRRQLEESLEEPQAARLRRLLGWRRRQYAVCRRDGRQCDSPSVPSGQPGMLKHVLQAVERCEVARRLWMLEIGFADVLKVVGRLD